MALDTYQKKRNFAKTKEPAGKQAKKRGNSFVIQHHDASREHYDFRLELDGVLKSWAVPKGPSLDPQQKRLAVHVEDHPLEYADFEGIIPQGEYGGGTVMVWDRGTWEVDGGHKDTKKAYKAGKLSFQLHGKKLKGGWALVRMRTDEKADNWLLIKEKDKASDPDTVITETKPDSVVSGRSMREIGKDHDRIWSSQKEAAGEISEDQPEQISQAKKAKFPTEIKPQLATLVDKPPKGGKWLHEIKLDGYRILAYKNKKSVSLLTRNQNEYNKRFPAVTKAMKELPVDTAVLDGEVVLYSGDGKTDFHELKRVMHHGDAEQLIYVAFDLLYLEGYNLRRAPLFERKHLLRGLLAKAPNDALRFSDHLNVPGNSVFEKACELRLEGIISKRRDRPYHKGRNRDWQKIKCLFEQEMVIGGYTDPQGSRSGFGALLLGYYADDGLRYAGRVGTGFDDDTLERLSKQLRKLEQKQSPYANPLTTAQKKNVHWVKPELVGQIAFIEWTKDGRLRHPAFQGLREDKDPKKVVREVPQHNQSKATSKSSHKKTKQKAMPSNNKSHTIAGIKLSHPDRVLFPEQGMTKQTLAQLYVEIADWVLPHLQNRPLSLLRCPQGRAKQCFYQKHAGDGFDDSVKRVAIEESGGEETYCYVDSIKAVVSLVQLGVLEFHIWGCHKDKIERPDRLIFDLDPDDGLDAERVIDAAKITRDYLEKLGLQSFLMATGGKGLHVVAPLERRHDWDTVKGFAKTVAGQMVKAAPERFIDTASKKKRKGKIFIDYLRNSRGATAIAPYSTRARKHAPVATPLRWDELSSDVIGKYTVDNIKRRLSTLKKDPWEGYDDVKQTLTQAMKKVS